MLKLKKMFLWLFIHSFKDNISDLWTTSGPKGFEVPLYNKLGLSTPPLNKKFIVTYQLTCREVHQNRDNSLIDNMQ